MKKRILSMTLALCMALTLFAGLPLSASAAGFELTWPNPWAQGTAPDWAINATKEEQAATIQAIYDEYDYQASIGFDMGTGPAFSAWGNMVNAQFENGDHTGNPWNQAGRRMGGIIAPYAGMAFSVKADFSQFYGFVPLGNQTTWTNPGDKTYMVQMAVGAQYVAAQNADGTFAAPVQWAEHVGWTATNKDAFQKAYAMTAAGKITGKRLNLGYAPTSVKQTADGTIEWQELRGDENTGSYGMFTAGGIAIIAMKTGSSEAYVICDEMFNAWKTTWVGTTQNDLTTIDMFSVTGAPVGNAFTVDGVTYQAFEKGTFVAKDGVLTGPFTDEVGFTVSDSFAYTTLEIEDNTYYYTVADDTDVSKLNLGITVNEKSTISVDLSGEYDYSKPVTFTVTAESGRVATYTIVILSNSSASTEDRLAALKVQQRIDALSATVYRNDLSEIDAIKAAYAALTPAQKSLVDMSKIDAMADRITELNKSEAIRVACVGDSITDGIGSLNANETYPAKMARLLGDDYQVVNYGISGYHVMTDRGYNADWDPRYYFSDKYKQSKELQPDIVIFALGTNDAGNSGMWDATAPAKFEADYKMMINEYLALDSHPIVLLSLPMACWDKNAEDPADWTHNGRHNNNVNGTIPIIKKIYEELKAAGEPVMLLDMQTFTINNPEWFGDGLHPNDNGYTIISAEYAKYVKEASAVLTDISIDAINLDGKAMDGFDADVRNYKVAVDSLDNLPEVTATYTESMNKTVAVAQATAENPTATVTVTSSVGTIGAVYSVTFFVEGDAEAAEIAEVEKLIGAIDDETITLADDEAAVELAQLSYNALSNAQKEKISDELTKKLNDAVAAIKALNDQKAADAVAAIIDEIGTVGLDSEAAIQKAADAYAALTDAQKALVGNVKTLTDAQAAWDALAPVREVIAMINKLPANITIGQQEDIQKAKDAYDALEGQQELVPEDVVKKLNDAIAALEAIVGAYTKYEGEDAVLAGGANVIDGNAAAVGADVSGGKFAGSLGAETGGGGTATFTVSVKEAGTYQLDIYYITWADRTVDVTVNGGASVNLACPGNNSDWNGNVKMVSTQVTLNAGNNTILIGNNTGWAPNIDFIALPVGPADGGEVKPNPDQEAADKVIKMIDDLGEIKSLEQEADVKAARAAFDALTDAQEALVTNKDKLVAAEAAIEALKPVGDVDGDGNVNVSDIIKLKNLIMEGDWTDAEFAAGNFNENDKLDVADIIALKNLIMGA